VQIEESVVGLGLLLEPPEIVKHRREAHPPFFGTGVDLERSLEGGDGPFQVCTLSEDVTLEDPCGVVLGFEVQGDGQMNERLLGVALFERAEGRVHRDLESIDAWEESLARFGL